MASIYSEIRAALENELSGVTGLPDIAWENVDFKPTTGTSFIRTQFNPTVREPAIRGLNPQQYYQGIFSVYCYCPENEGPSACDDIADLVINAFDATTDINYTVDTNTTINLSIRYATRNMGMSNPPWYLTVVDIGWYIYN